MVRFQHLEAKDFLLLNSEYLYRNAAVKKSTLKRKKPSSKTQISQLQRTTTDTETDVTVQPTAKLNPLPKRTFDVNNNLNEFFRSMDADVILLFEEKLELKYPLPEEFIGECLGLLEFK